MKTKDTIHLLIFCALSIVPEVLLATYLQDFFHRDFIESLFIIYGVLIGIVAIRFILSWITFNLFLKDKIIKQIYSLLLTKKFPNPWNHGFGYGSSTDGNKILVDGLSYFESVAENHNNELIDGEIRAQAMKIFAEVSFLKSNNQFGLYWRMKKCLNIAVNKFMDDYFHNTLDELSLTEENILKDLIKYNFPSPGKYPNITDAFGYFQEVVKDFDNKNWSFDNNLQKILSITFMEGFRSKNQEMYKDQMSYDIDISDKRNIIESQLQICWNAINKYSEEKPYIKK